jgi:uncharacterized SAM-binding protein YcdF (DUF218 family)
MGAGQQSKTMIQDIAKFLTNPLLYIWIGLLVSLYKFSENRRRLIALNIMFYCLCIGFSGTALKYLWYVNDTYDENVVYDAAILLGGVIEQADPKSIDDFGYDFRLATVDRRLVRATGFVKSGHAKLLLFGNCTVSDYDEGPLIRKFAEFQGLKEDELEIYGDVRRTVDEANGVKIFLEENKYKKVILITSPIHMRRALAMFNKVGIFPDSYSGITHSYKIIWTDFIPTGKGAKHVQGFFYELFGYVGYCLKGNI